MKETRGYTMRARAASVERTRRRILEATVGLADDRRVADISLDEVARSAGVSVQTVLRHFGSRADLIDAAVGFARTEVVQERRTPVGDIDAALRVVVDHYEHRGDAVLLLLAQEDTDPVVRQITERGKEIHRRWVTEVFAPHTGADDVLVDLLVVATDVYAWKLLRRDRGLSRARTEARMKTLVASVLATRAPKGTSR